MDFVFEGEALRLYVLKRSSRASVRPNRLDIFNDLRMMGSLVREWLFYCGVSYSWIEV